MRLDFETFTISQPSTDDTVIGKVIDGELNALGTEACASTQCNVGLFSARQARKLSGYYEGWQSPVLSRFLSDFNSGPFKEHLPESKVQGSTPGGCLIIFYDLSFSHHF